MRRVGPFYVALAVAVLAFAVYLPVLRNGFLIWDDTDFIISNYHIHSLNLDLFWWAASDFSLDYWRPLTWISQAIDYALWGGNPLGHHLTGILLHALNTFLVVYLVVRLLRAANWAELQSGGPARLSERMILISAGVTGVLFGVHPLRVEPVAWAGDRADLLYPLFWLLSLISYVTYVFDVADKSDQPGAASRPLNRWYIWSLGLFALSLASKPVAVTLPLVLLILDWHPLARIRSFKTFLGSCVEKMPFIVLSLVVSALVLWGEKAYGRVDFPTEVAVRVLVAFKAMANYLRQMILPFDLIPYYPYPDKASLMSPEYLLATAIVVGITAACLIVGRKQRTVAAVWAYFVITLLPVLGIIKARAVYMADRYTYMPGLGIAMIMGLIAALAWEKADSLSQWKITARRVIATGAVLLCLLLAYSVILQIAVWKNSIVLWSYVIDKEPERVPLAYNNRGVAFQRELQQPSRALDDYTRAIALDMSNQVAYMAYTNRGLVFGEFGQYDQAIQDYNAAIALNPKYADAYDARGQAYKDTGRFDRALEDFNAALALDGTRYQTYVNRGALVKELGRPESAGEDFDTAIRLNPRDVDAYIFRGMVRKDMGRFGDAIDDYSKAIGINPGRVEAYNNRGVALKHLNRLESAIQDFDRAISLNPSFALAYCNRATVRGLTGHADGAIEDYTKALSLDRNLIRAYLERGELYQQMGHGDSALRDYQQACERGSKEGCGVVHAGGKQSGVANLQK